MKPSIYTFETRTVTVMIILAVLVLIQLTLAQTEVEGEVAGIWELEGSPYIAVNNLIVPEDEELLIEPGVGVLLQDRFVLTVLGTLIAEGEAENLIRFGSVGEDQDAWGTGLSFEGENSNVSLNFVVIENQIIDTNEEDWQNQGGGIRILGGEHQINNSIIQLCQAHIGGGLFLSGGLCVIRNSEFLDNQATSTGGGIFGAAGLKLLNCYLSNNGTANDDQRGASAIYLGQERNSEDSLVVTGCRLEGNLESETGAFVISNIYCPFNFAFNEIINNESPGFIFWQAGFETTIIDHFTIYGNNVGVGGGSLGPSVVTNSILWGNEGGDIVLRGAFNGSLTARNSDVEEAVGIVRVVDCISVDPRLFDVEGLVNGSPDFRLRADSPCIDAGFEGTDMGANLFEAEEFNQEVPLIQNWNGVSLRVVPQNPNIIEIFAQIVERENLRLVKDDFGRFYAPEWGFININGWIYSKGYQVNTNEADLLEVEGVLVQHDEPIDLSAGWNIISCYSEQDIWVGDALELIQDQVLLAKNSDGLFWNPRFGWGFDFRAGQAFWIKVIEDTRFAFPILEEEDERAAASANLWSEWDNVLTEYGLTATGKTMNMILNSSNINKSAHILAKSEDGDIFGAGICADGYSATILYGDDETTDLCDGFLEGSQISLYYYKEGSSVTPVRISNPAEPLIYETNGFLDMSIEMSSLPEPPDEFTLSGIFPNPFNSTTRITFGLNESAGLSIRILDISGRIIATLVEGKYIVGTHEIIWDATSLSSGIYFVNLKSDNQIRSSKVVLVR